MKGDVVIETKTIVYKKTYQMVDVDKLAMKTTYKILKRYLY